MDKGLIIAIVAGGFIWWQKKQKDELAEQQAAAEAAASYPDPPPNLTTSQKRTTLIQFIKDTGMPLGKKYKLPGAVTAMVAALTPGEVDLLFDYFFNYVKNSIPLEIGSAFYADIYDLANKYGLTL